MRRVFLRYALCAFLLLMLCQTGAFFSPVGTCDETYPYTKINVHEARAMIEADPGMLVLDVQDREGYMAGHIMNSVPIPLGELKMRAGELVPCNNVLIYGKNEYQSTSAGEILYDGGWDNIYAMCCGVRGWISASYSVYVRYPSLQSALDTMEVGATIRLSSGTYDGPFTVGKTATILGENMSSTHIDGRGEDICMNVTAPECSLSNLSFANGTTGLAAYDSEGTIIENCAFSSLSEGIWLRGSRRTIMKKNSFDCCGLRLSGEQAEQWNSHEITAGNEVNGKSLLYMNDASDGTVSGEYGQVVLANCSSVELRDLVLEGGSHGIIIGFSDSSRIEGCMISSNNEAGVEMIRSSDTVIVNNTIEMNGGDGILMDRCSGSNVSGNMIKDCKGSGIRITGGSGNVVHDNTFIRNRPEGAQGFDSGTGNTWNMKDSGNYWSDHMERYPLAGSINGSWDVPYELAGSAGSVDGFPLIRPPVIEAGSPIADAGPDIGISQHEQVSFDGSYSLDAEGIENYTWGFFYSGGMIRLYGPRPNFVFDLAGEYDVKLEVTNTQGNSSEDHCIVLVVDTEAPLAAGGSDVLIEQRGTAVLDASGSSDNTGIMEYTWTFRYNGTRIVLRGQKTGYRFDDAGEYVIELRAADAGGNAGIDEVTVFVKDVDAPHACPKAGDTTVSMGERVLFDASASSDNVGIVNYTWSITGNTVNITLYGSTGHYTFGSPGQYDVVLAVSDADGNRDTSNLALNVKDVVPPEALAGTDVHLKMAGTVCLDGSNSLDNVGIVNYTWSFRHGGENVSLHGPEHIYYFREPGNYSVLLKVRDAAGNQDIDRISVVVDTGGRGREEDGKPLGVLAANLAMVILIVLLFAYLYRKHNLKASGDGKEHRKESSEGKKEMDGAGEGRK